MKKNTFAKLLTPLLTLPIVLNLAGCSQKVNSERLDDLSNPNTGSYWGAVSEQSEKEINTDIDPEVTITYIGDDSKADTISKYFNDGASIYDLVYENVNYNLKTVGFETDLSMAINYDDTSGKSTIGIMYYYGDFNLFDSNACNFVSSGFYEILELKEKSSHLENVENLYVHGFNQETENFLCVYDYLDIESDHFIYQNQYVIYYQEGANTIRYYAQDNIKENYNLTLGSLYDYDKNEYVYDDGLYDKYVTHSGTALFGEEDYAELQSEMKAFSDSQLENGYVVTSYSIVYISPESIQAYIESDEEDTFFGYQVKDLTEGLGVGTALEYKDGQFFESQVIEQKQFNWKSFLIKMGIGAGIIIIGAALSYFTAGTSFACALVTISKYALSFAVSSALTSVLTTSVKGFIEGKSFIESITDATFAGLDSFSTGFVIGAAIGAIGVATRLIKPSACFVAGTPVLCGPSTYVAIENLKVGDYVTSYNEYTQKVSFNKITETFLKETDVITKLSLDNHLINTTPTHPFYSVTRKGWVRADELKIGESLINFEGKKVSVDDKNTLLLDKPIPVYNLTVDNDHTYFVGKNNVLVHNSCIDSQYDYYRSKAGRDAKKQWLDDIKTGRDYHGLNPNRPADLDIIQYVKDFGKFPSNCHFAHAVDGKLIKEAYTKGIISEEQFKLFLSDPNNGILTSQATHLSVFHGGSWHNATAEVSLKTMVEIRPAILSTIRKILEAIGKIGLLGGI